MISEELRLKKTELDNLSEEVNRQFSAAIFERLTADCSELPVALRSRSDELSGSISEHKIQGHSIFIIDGLLSEYALDTLSSCTAIQTYRPRLRHPSGRDIASYMAQPDLASLEAPGILRVLSAIPRTLFPSASPAFLQAHVICSIYGAWTEASQAAAGSTGVNLICYLNKGWEQKWGAETIFFDSMGEARLVVTPRFGRLLVSHSSVPFRIGVPSRMCTAEHVVLLCQFS